MIVSASYKTDIPAFYGEWFLHRLDAGYCMMRNPYNGRAVRVPLGTDDIDGFVFWTKNAGPFQGVLDEVARRGYPFVVQYSINGYPRELEGAVADADRNIAHLRRIRDCFGPHAAVWRYDPLLSSSLTPPEFHRQNFARLAAALEGATNEVVISFAQIYQKTRRNLALAADKHGFTWSDPEDDEKRELAATLACLAARHGMTANVCSQRQYVAEGLGEAACVSAARLSRVAGREIIAERRGNRPDCACDASRDIGDYDTCPHGCVYCYAVRDRVVAQQRYREHDPTGEFLFTPTP